jgi:hypothetical protein
MLKHPRYIRIPDNNGNLTRVLKLHRFNDTDKVFYVEPAFWLFNGEIVRKDGLVEGVDIYGVNGCGFLPSTLTEFKEYCRTQYHKFKDEEVLINRYAVDFLGAKEPPYNDKKVTSTKYFI